LNLDSDKDPLRVLIHEIGHIKWPGYASSDPSQEHSPEFYKLLGDSLTRFGLEPDSKDLPVDISKVSSPAGNGDTRLFNVPPPRTIVPKRPGNQDFMPGAETNAYDQPDLPYYGVRSDATYGANAGPLQLYSWSGGTGGARNALLGPRAGNAQIPADPGK
jgi:hypothetical protein